ncbi:MAG: ATP-binding protein [Terriglobia bacterium]
MRISLKVKLTALISLLVLVVVLGISALYLLSFVDRTLEDIQKDASYIRDEAYMQARAVVAATRLPPYINPKDLDEVRAFVQVRLSQDPGLRSLMQSAAAYSSSIDYVAITGKGRFILAHNDPSQIGQTLPPAPPLSDLLNASIFRQFHIIYGPPAVYEIVMPLGMKGRPFGDIRVGISTVFLAAQVTPHLKSALEMVILAVVIATLTAGVLSFRLLKPLVAISQSVDRMARGEFTEPFKIKRADEWGILSGKLNLLGEQLRGEKAAYLALKENLDQLFANLVDGLLMFDHEDRLTLATPSSARFLDRPVDDLVARPASEVFAGEGNLNQLLREAYQEQKSLSGEMVEVSGSSETSRVAITTHFVNDHDKGRRIASLVMLRDVDTRAQLEDEIGLTARLAAMGRLTSGVAHEVKNPLNAMILQLEILRSKLLDRGTEVKPQLDILSKEIRRLDRVVKTFLDFTRPIEIHRTETDLATLVREVFTLAEPHAQRLNVRLVLEPNGSLPPLKVDRDLMKQVLLNVVLNGCQAMPEGGELRVKPHAGSRSVDLEISDQGVGIPEEARQKVFSLFYSTKPGGTGIGLAMAFRIVQLHDGSIEFSSEINHGTTFRISLPA